MKPIVRMQNVTSEFSRPHWRNKFSLARFGCAWLAIFLAVSPLLAQGSVIQGKLQAAAAAERDGRYDEAAGLYQKCLSSLGPSAADAAVRVHVRTRLATDYYLLHRYRESLDAVIPVISKDSSAARAPVQAWLVDGLDRLELGKLPGAIRSLRKTLVLNPDSGTARLALGDALARSGRLEESARQFEEQTRRTPSLPDAWYKLGLVYERLAAEASHVFAQKLPAGVVGRQLEARELMEAGDYLRAAGVLGRVLRQSPGQPQAHAELGTVLLTLGYPRAAENQFRQELSENPLSPLAELGLAETAALSGNWQEATSSLEQLSRSNPQELIRLTEIPPAGLVQQAWREGRAQLPESLAGSLGGSLWKAWLDGSGVKVPSFVNQASEPCTQASSKAWATPGLWLSETCYRKLRDELQSKKVLTPREREKLTEAELRLGQFSPARRDAQIVLQVNPRNEWALFWLNQSYGGLGEECFLKVTALDPNSARNHQILAQYYANRRFFPAATKEFQAALQLAPDLPDLHLGLGTVYWQSGDWPRSERELSRTLELAPKSEAAQFGLGDTYLQERRWRDARDLLKRDWADPVLGMKARIDLAKADEEIGN
ncbi:MAG: hypothetical protein DMG21_19510, partial [Acidobacteria bacterium]